MKHVVDGERDLARQHAEKLDFFLAERVLLAAGEGEAAEAPQRSRQWQDAQ